MSGCVLPHARNVTGVGFVAERPGARVRPTTHSSAPPLGRGVFALKGRFAVAGRRFRSGRLVVTEQNQIANCP